MATTRLLVRGSQTRLCLSIFLYSIEATQWNFWTQYFSGFPNLTLNTGMKRTLVKSAIVGKKKKGEGGLRRRDDEKIVTGRKEYLTFNMHTDWSNLTRLPAHCRHRPDSRPLQPSARQADNWPPPARQAGSWLGHARTGGLDSRLYNGTCRVLHSNLVGLEQYW